MHPFRDFTVDHIIPVSKGGQNTDDNLVPCCRPCNRTKKAKTIGEIREQGQTKALRLPVATERSEWADTLTISQAAELLGVHQNTLRGWADKGLVPVVKLPSGYRRFRPSDIERELAKMESAPTRAPQPKDGEG